MQLSFNVQKPADVIFNYLTDMQLFASVHPVITKMEEIGNNRYKVYEKFMLGPVPYSFTYAAEVASNASENSITINATVMKLTKIEMQFQIKEHDGYCIVHENIAFKSPLPVKGIMSKVFKTQHRKLFENIDNLQIRSLPLQN